MAAIDNRYKHTNHGLITFFTVQNLLGVPSEREQQQTNQQRTFPQISISQISAVTFRSVVGQWDELPFIHAFDQSD